MIPLILISSSKKLRASYSPSRAEAQSHLDVSITRLKGLTQPAENRSNHRVLFADLCLPTASKCHFMLRWAHTRRHCSGLVSTTFSMLQTKRFCHGEESYQYPARANNIIL